MVALRSSYYMTTKHDQPLPRRLWKAVSFVPESFVWYNIPFYIYFILVPSTVPGTLVPRYLLFFRICFIGVYEPFFLNVRNSNTTIKYHNIDTNSTEVSGYGYYPGPVPVPGVPGYQRTRYCTRVLGYPVPGTRVRGPGCCTRVPGYPGTRVPGYQVPGSLVASYMCPW